MTMKDISHLTASAGDAPGCRPEAVGSPLSMEQQAAQHRYRRAAGECAYCDRNRNDSMMPSHTPSSRCESGKHAHCTCDTCY